MLKSIFRQMSIAQIVSGLTVVLCLLIDSIMIGRFLGVDAMAAYGLASPVLLVFAAIGSTVSTGVQVMCSKAFGKGDTDAVNQYFSIVLLVLLAVSALGVIGIGCFSGSFSTFLGAGTSGVVFDNTKSYLIGFIFGIPAFLAATVLVPFLQFAGRQNVLVVAVAVMTAGDICFDLLNVYVLDGGMLGMGLASSFSYILACVIGLSYFLTKKCIYTFKAKLFSKEKLLEILHAGIPTLINMLSLVLLSFTFNHILIRIGDAETSANAVAAYAIIATGSNICYAFPSGIGNVTLMLAGIYYFEDDRSSIRSLVKLMLKSQLIVNAVITAVVFSLAPFLVRLFVPLETEAQVISLATTGLRLFVLSALFNGFNTGMKQYYQGILHIRLAEGISVLQNFVGTACFAFVLSRFLGATGVWLGYLCGEMSISLLIIGMVKYKHKKRKITLDDLLLLPQGFGVPDEQFLRAIVKCPEEVTAFSKQAADFCRQYSKNKKCCLYVGLFIEELGTNIVKNCYGDKRKQNRAEFSLFFSESSFILRIRDDGKPFDPQQYTKMLDDENKALYPSIQMLYSLADDVKYSDSMAQNSLILTLDTSFFEQEICAD